MFILFDLDDTLIDTSGCITPIKLQDALRRMVAEGLVIADMGEALEMVRRLDETAESAKHTLAEFLEIQEADPRFLEIGVKEVYENISPDIPVFPFSDAVELLSELAVHHELVLVTQGSEELQRNKMKKAGIDMHLFSKIVVCGAEGKKIHYQSIVEERGVEREDVIACGDRIAIDLTPAKELGFTTVHVRKGRGKHSTGPKSDVDYSILELQELREILLFSTK